MKLSFRISERKTLLIVVDLMLVNAATLLALWVWAVRGAISFDRAFVVDQFKWFLFLSAIWFFASFLAGLYELVRVANPAAGGRALAQTIGLMILGYLGVYFAFPEPGALPRGVVLYQGAISFVLIGLWRAAFSGLILRSAFARKAVIVGAGESGQEIAELVSRNAAGHYQILGFMDEDTTTQGKKIAIGRVGENRFEFPVLGTGRDLVRFVRENDASEIILAITGEIPSSLFDALLECKVQGVEITLMPVLYEQLTGQVPVDYIGNNWSVVMPLETAEAGGWYIIIKRIFDVVGATIGLLVFFTFFPFFALAIYLDSPGPIFYSHVRAGKGGRLFNLMKLRTMIIDAERNGAKQAEVNDPRVTRVGRWLRKMRLDEMPQLLNVLKGEMSAVGPRPERPEHLKEFDNMIPFHRLRNSVKPGMAGWAVINYDYIDSIEDAKIRLQYDLYYIKHQSLSLDLFILLRTIGQVFAFRGR